MLFSAIVRGGSTEGNYAGSSAALASSFDPVEWALFPLSSLNDPLLIFRVWDVRRLSGSRSGTTCGLVWTRPHPMSNVLT